MYDCSRAARRHKISVNVIAGGIFTLNDLIAGKVYPTFLLAGTECL